jgi:hypothetical protein
MKSIIVWVALWIHVGALAAYAQGVGAIGGTVTDQSGGVMPGVSVSLLSEGVAGGAQQVVTDTRGGYEFARLVPGTYGVRAELAGFKTMTREGIVVSAAATARADFRMEVGSLEEGVTVTGEAPLLDTTSALTQTVMDRETVAALPSRLDLWSVGRAVPSVVMNKYDVGGTEQYANSSATVHGAADGQEGSYRIDGMDVDGGSSAGASLSYADPTAFQEINFQVGNAAAESARGGLAYNMVTRTGTNTIHGDYMYSTVLTGLQGNNITPDLRRDLLSAVPAKVFAANPNLDPRSDITRMINTSGSVGGPIVKDRLWFAFTFDYGRLDFYRVGSYKTDGSLFLDDNYRQTHSEKISWQVKSGHQVHAYHMMQDKGALHRTGDNPSEFYEDRWSERQKPNARYVEQARWTGVVSSRAVTELGASMLWGSRNVYPQLEVGPGDIPAYDNVTRTHMNSRPTYAWIKPFNRILQPTMTVSAASHDIKLGYTFRHGYESTENYSFSHFPAGLRAVFRNGAPDSVNTYNTPTSRDMAIIEHGAFVQDRWSVNRKLTVNLGLRIETSNGDVPARCQVETVFVKGQCWPEQPNVTDFADLSPRFSVVYDVFGNGRTALKFAANRYMLGVGHSISNRLDPIVTTSDTRTWNDTNGDRVPQLNELGPSTGFNLGTTNRYVENLKRPRSIEMNATIEHQLPGAVVVSAAYYHREIREQIGSRNVAVPTSAYTAMQVREVVSGRDVTVYNLDPAYRGLFDTVWSNMEELNSEFNGVDLGIRKRLSNRWMIMGGASFGKNVGDIYGGNDLNNPNPQFRRGVLGSDVPRAIKLMGMYQLPWDISLSSSMQHTSGFPERTTVSVGRDSATLTQVTQTITVEPQGTTRLPSVTLFDVSFRRAFRFGGERSIEPTFDLYNLMNANTITGQITQLGPSHNRVTSILRARLAKVNVNIRF